MKNVQNIIALIVIVLLALLLFPRTVDASECPSSTLAFSLDNAEKNGGKLYDMLPVDNNPDIDNIVIIEFENNLFGMTLERDGCIVGPPVSTMVILPKEKGTPS